MILQRLAFQAHTFSDVVRFRQPGRRVDTDGSMGVILVAEGRIELPTYGL